MGPAAADASPAALTVETRPGQTAAAVRALGAGGLRVQRRLGTRVQVVADPRRASALRALPGVAAVRPAGTAVPDQAPRGTVVSQGLRRTGADVLAARGDGAAELVIAVLDLGFGENLAAMQAAGELPPWSRLEVASFDTVSGLAGTNVYGNRTNHGEIVAQTVFDYAPRARYVFVNYHSEADFVAATEWLIQRRPDIVVHSNNFLEGPFDGTGPLARAVDRAAAAGILWFNSAGNYAQQHWSGPWVDADSDGTLDWPEPGWTFRRNLGQPITFALSWRHDDPAAPTDLDLVLERRTDAGSWVEVEGSRDRQGAGAPPSERLTGWRATASGEYRLRVVHVAGPPPTRSLTLFTREVPLTAAGGTPAASVPTPADARGAVAVGGVNWRGDRLMAYSSNGPSHDGRLKPDLVAPTNTDILGTAGVRGVGGTSNAAPNAAGVAALLMAQERRAGRPGHAASIRRRLAARALDLGPPGPDPMYGHGRVRAPIAAPRIVTPVPAPGAHVRGVVFARFGALTPTLLTSWSLALGGRPVGGHAARRAGAVRVDTRRLRDGVHTLVAEARDHPGNVGRRAWRIRVDNTPPRVRAARVAVGRPAPTTPATTAAETPRPPTRPARLHLVAVDPGAASPLEVRTQVLGVPGTARRVRARSGAAVTVALGPLPRGRHTVRVRVTDGAGNAHSVGVPALVR